MTTRTRCSSTTRADTVVKAPGSTSRTRPVQRFGSAPVGDRDRRTWVDGNRLGGQDVDDNLQIDGIADLQQWRARRDDGVAFPQHAKRPSVHPGCHRISVGIGVQRLRAPRRDPRLVSPPTIPSALVWPSRSGRVQLYWNF